LKGPVVGTLMTNYGLERAFASLGIDFRRAGVGDRYVLAMLRETGGVLGGETSGHLLTLDHATTGDAMVAALQVLAVMRQTGRSLAELTAGLELYPQTMINLRVARRFDPNTHHKVAKARDSISQRLGDRGRIVLRASGTEPLIRVMVEAEDDSLGKALAAELAEVVKAAAEEAA
jgi:phosphoglucosamine mutase